MILKSRKANLVGRIFIKPWPTEGLSGWTLLWLFGLFASVHCIMSYDLPETAFFIPKMVRLALGAATAYLMMSLLYHDTMAYSAKVSMKR